ncbi:class I SAM-dependent methyltransferase [Actinomadura hibisca]|uniref:class I SAM-dependent methyltransferase n=1 Tax=Actinomadura hibisca TaxID=68565 RepID=UPI00082BA39B|nr:class I SAM-dependent methyltransferase [Actinomadura hibisca]
MASTLRTRRQHWYEHWADQRNPQHAKETEDAYQDLAGELRNLFAAHRADRVLEIGCGDGALFDLLGFNQASRYLGVDFSQAMLDQFRARFPRTDLRTADASRFRTDERFDLIFSSHVAQYWDRGQMARHLDHAAAMLAPDGLIVIAGIPWSRMRLAYGRGDLTGGDLTGGRRRSLPGALASAVRELVAPDIGHWYDLPEVTRLAAARGMRANFRGSGHYPYRFHALFQRTR